MRDRKKEREGASARRRARGERTGVCPAISMPASRKSSKLWLNLPEAAASWRLELREAWTTSPADWLSSAAVWVSSLWASWKDLEEKGTWTAETVVYMQGFHVVSTIV